MKFSTLMLLSLLVACGGGGGGGGSTNSPYTNKGLLGTWSQCENEIEAPAASYLHKVAFTEAGLSYNFYSYSDEGCDPGKLESTQTVEYKYVVNGSNLDLTVQKVSKTLHLESGALGYDVASARDSALCDLPNWTLNVANDITNLYCDDVIVVYGSTDSVGFSLNGNQLTIGEMVYIKE